MKSEYRSAADVTIEKIVTSINMIVNDERNEWENDTTDDIWKKWARKTDMKRRCASSILINTALFVKSQYIKISKQIWWTRFEKFWKTNFELKTAVSLETTTSLVDFKMILKLEMIL